ncbi:DUF4833 domain-containing protein [Siphonobacter sp.]|uniref:DUF4833 domain-containing protein n=1 Tax=Siphonobacter sp. TaxID=1869184 RepID=UPI003B39FBBB
MKTFVSFLLILGLILHSFAQATTIVPGKATLSPKTASRQLFYLQRSKDANTVVYEANESADRKLNPNKPVEVYWIRYAEQGQREDLSRIQWQLAYGYTHQPMAGESYEVRLNAFPERVLKVQYHQGKVVAMTTISGQRACLQKVFVQLDPKARLVPKVKYVEMFGVDPESGRAVYERIIP